MTPEDPEYCEACGGPCRDESVWPEPEAVVTEPRRIEDSYGSEAPEPGVSPTAIEVLLAAQLEAFYDTADPDADEYGGWLAGARHLARALVDSGELVPRTHSYDRPTEATLLKIERDRLAAEVTRWRQVIWDALGIMGFDLDGQPTPAASGMLDNFLLDSARTMRQDLEADYVTHLEWIADQHNKALGRTQAEVERLVAEQAQLQTVLANLVAALRNEWAYNHSEQLHKHAPQRG